MKPRDHAFRIAHETVAFVDAGSYRNTSGHDVPLRDAVLAAQCGTREYPPEHPLPAPRKGPHATRFSVANEPTVNAARRFAEAGHDPLVLNFASAKNPGGGFLGGARAQEESLARASALYACIAGRAMYAHGRALRDAAYTSWAIYSPRVPFFRTEDGALLDAPYLASVVTAAAVNAKVVLERDPSRADGIVVAMRQRIARVLTIAQLHGHRALVLGAWGCGVFGNDPEMIARELSAALRGPFAGAFEHVAFAVLDGRERRNIAPFEALFGDAPRSG